MSIGLRLRKRQVKIENRNLLKGGKNRRVAKIESVHPIEGCRSATGIPRPCQESV